MGAGQLAQIVPSRSISLQVVTALGIPASPLLAWRHPVQVESVLRSGCLAQAAGTAVRGLRLAQITFLARSGHHGAGVPVGRAPAPPEMHTLPPPAAAACPAAACPAGLPRSATSPWHRQVPRVRGRWQPTSFGKRRHGVRLAGTRPLRTPLCGAGAPPPAWRVRLAGKTPVSHAGDHGFESRTRYSRFTMAARRRSGGALG